MDLALLTGQRPADVLKIERTDLRDGALWIVHNKTALGGAGRSYSVLEDSDEALLVKLTLREDDIDQARNDMEVLCSKHGVTREVV